MLGLSMKKIHNNVRVVFGSEAAFHGEHGKVIVSCKRQNYTGREVSFAFVGVLTAPPLTRDIVNLIYDEAQEQGYIVHGITAYTTITKG